MIHLVYVLASEAPKVQVPAFMENPWFLALLGWIIYNVGKLLVDQKKYDLNNDGIGWSEGLAYLKFSWVGMVLSLLLLPLVIPYTHDIWHIAWGWFGKEFEFTKLAYGGVGLLMIAFQYGILWIKERFSKK